MGSIRKRLQSAPVPGRGWRRRFEDPIAVTDTVALVTLEDAAAYIQRLPKAEHGKPEWQLAAQILIDAAEGRGPLMHAHIAMLRAINAGVDLPKKERRKAVKKYRIVR